jgi:predicted hotdog family 3-hydroxylacyl-ACP dehydratase
MTEAELSRQLNQLVGMSAAEFVLHRKPMLLPDQLVKIGPRFATCEWCVQADNEFLIQNIGVPSYIGVEYMAQCIAVHAGALERVFGFPPPLGFLLGTRHYQAEVRYFEVGVTYQVECKELIRTSDGMGSFDCQILLNNQSVAKARLAVLQQPRGTSLDE